LYCREALPLYGNTHTTTSATGLQTTCFLVESRGAVATAVNARRQYDDANSDVVLFCGAGATAAACKLVAVLGLGAPLPPGAPDASRPLVLVGPHEHHSNLLPWRESAARVRQLPPARHGRGVCLLALAAALREAQAAGTPLIIGAFAAASNVTGVVEDVDAVTRLLHAHGALAVWDFAAAACGGPALDMNPPGGAATAKDAMFFSPHKLPGGPGAPGVLVAKRALFRNAVPSRPGGGTVFFVTEAGHRYVSNREEREEGGTPDALGAMRAAAAMRARTAAERAEHEAAPAAPAPEGQPRAAPTSGPAAAGSRIAARLYASLAQNDAVAVLGPPMEQGEHRLATISFLIRSPAGSGRWLHPSFVCAALNDLFGLQSRGGCDCAGPYGLRLLGVARPDAAAIERELETKQAWAEALRPGWTRVRFCVFLFAPQIYAEADITLLQVSLPWFASDAEVGYTVAAIHAIAVRAAPFPPANPSLTALLRQAHGWRLLPLYRFNARSGEWKHASRLTRFPERRWLASLKWPAPEALTQADDVVPGDADAGAASDDVDATGERAAHGAALRSAAAEAALEAAWAAQLAQAGPAFAAASAEGATAAAGADAYGGADLGAHDEDDAGMGALRWFALPSEAAAVLAAERAAGRLPDAAALAAGSMEAGCELPALMPSSHAWAAAPPGPIQPLVFAADGSCTCGDDDSAHENGGDAPRALAEWSRKHPLRTDADGPAFSDADALRALRPQVAGASAAPPPAVAFAEASSSDDEADQPLPPPPADAAPSAMPPASAASASAPRRVAPPRQLMRQVSQAIAEWDMIREGDRLLLGLSGGKDSLSLLHVLLDLQARAPVRFEVGAATVDPGTDAYDPRPLKAYCASLGVPYYYLENTIFADAAGGAMSGDSICAFCARMKRGALYSCCRREGYTTLVLGQHLDDFAESFLMSFFHNGALRTMQAAYTCAAGDVRVVRPLLRVRESALKAFAYGAGLPVIADNCPACFEAPKERARVKKLLRREEAMYPRLFANLGAAMAPLADARVPPLLRAVGAGVAAARHRNKRHAPQAKAKAKARAAQAAEAEEAAAADVAPSDAEALQRVPEAALLAELRRRGGLGVGSEAAGVAAAEDEAAEDAADAAAAARGSACAFKPRAKADIADAM
jgi:selenocysteine lyase/cysteine desulfurase/tRNA(Ile)-lysidine synthase TilS/MesJ